jgi:hypothetical protein
MPPSNAESVENRSPVVRASPAAKSLTRSETASILANISERFALTLQVVGRTAFRLSLIGEMGYTVDESPLPRR